MAYKITSQCTGTDTICEDICAYGGIHAVGAASATGSRHLEIDEEQCTDCGACAVACPQGAIVYDDGFIRRQGQPAAVPATKAPVVAAVTTTEQEEPPVRSFNMTVELPDGYLVLNGKVESWARLMARCSD